MSNVINKHKKITICWGIPGSGKTTYVKEQSEISSNNPQRKSSVTIVDLDSIAKRFPNEFIRMFLQYFEPGHPEVIIDGLITTNQFARKILQTIKDHLSECFELDFHIIWWKRDIKACLHNDKNRRKLNSTATIKNMPFEEPSQELINEFGITVEKKQVIRKPMYKIWAGEQKLYNVDVLESSSWCLGGTWRNYQGYSGHVSSTPQPIGFKEFDALLEKACPQITFLQYKKLYGETVSIKEKSDYDNYGGCRTYAKFVCNLSKLYALLVSMGAA